MIRNLISRRSPSAVASATSGSCTAPAPTPVKTSQTYYHRNQQYSIVGLTNAAGTLVERYTYSAYGTLGIYAASGTVRTSSTYANRYTYTGREWDVDLRLYHFRARWYDPATGGFIARDPLGYVDGMSLYRGYFGGTASTDWSGTTTMVPEPWDWHHLVPWELFPEARRSNYHINDADNGWGLPRSVHKKLHSLGWNTDWSTWYRSFRDRDAWPSKQDFIDQVENMKTHEKYAKLIEQGLQAPFDYPETYTREYRGDRLVPGKDGKPKLGPNARRIGTAGIAFFLYQILDVAEPVAAAADGVSLACGGCQAEFDRVEASLNAFYQWNGRTTFNCMAVVESYRALLDCGGIESGVAGVDWTTAEAMCVTKLTTNGSDGHGIGFSFPLPPLKRARVPMVEGVTID